MFRSRWMAVGIVSVAAASSSVTLAIAETLRVITPPSLNDVEGTGYGAPGSGPTRIQFLIPASDFDDVPATHRDIVGWNFRADIDQTIPVDWTGIGSQIWMSTTDKTPTTLTTTFDDNHGTDKTLVLDGSVVFPLTTDGPVGGPRDFADGPRLIAPFHYDPTQGILLIEWARQEGTPEEFRIDVFPTNDPGATVLLNPASNSAATGDLFNQPAALQFEFVPESSSAALAMLALVHLLAAWRRPRGLR
jgi:hypothetical protein